MSNPEKYFPESHYFSSYQEYCSFGGQLNEEFFNQALEFLKNGQQLKSQQKVYIQSGRHCAYRAGVIPSPQEERLYVFLRELMPPPSSVERKSQDNKGFPWQLGDNSLLAEVFLLNNNIPSYQQFTDYFPHIFNKEEKSG